MPGLIGEEIRNTYSGLIKLDDSTGGITPTLQELTDGDGTPVGVRIAENKFDPINIPSYTALKGKYYGNGFSTGAASAFAANTQNIIIATMFYDLGRYSYSAMSVNVITATTSSDTCEGAFYTAQMTENGLMPHIPILSGITIPTTAPLGVNTITFGSDLSFSGYGAGPYFFVYKVSNSGVTPTVRWGTGQQSITPQLAPQSIYGFTRTPGTIGYVNSTSANGSSFVFSGQTTFDDPFASTIYTTQTETPNINTPGPGFILHTTDF